jgi:hypothetical protein
VQVVEDVPADAGQMEVGVQGPAMTCTSRPSARVTASSSALSGGSGASTRPGMAGMTVIVWP